MSIPLDRLYNFINELCNDDILIYRWTPHGSKKMQDLKLIKKTSGVKSGRLSLEEIVRPSMICHDQEPLNYDLYLQDKMLPTLQNAFKTKRPQLEPQQNFARTTSIFSHWHLRAWTSPFNIHDQTLILHSEKNSLDLKKYQNNNYVPVYYWCHALISLDWFRFAKHDTVLQQNKKIYHKKFLVYNRAWSGTREYRLKFSDLIIEHNLHHSCNMKFNPVCNNHHYRQYALQNSNFRPNHTLENHYALNQADSTCSADYDSKDYTTSGMEIVLETLFDDSRLHLTEKTLRPIACGMPFILAAPAGSLKYLHEYGFKTFGEYFDESYDDIADPVSRLHAIVKLIKWIDNLDAMEFDTLLNNCALVTKFNRAWFFSEQFSDLVLNELRTNLDQGISQVKSGPIGNLFRQCVRLNWELDRERWDELIDRKILHSSWLTLLSLEQQRRSNLVAVA